MAQASSALTVCLVFVGKAFRFLYRDQEEISEALDNVERKYAKYLKSNM